MWTQKRIQDHRNGRYDADSANRAGNISVSRIIAHDDTGNGGGCRGAANGDGSGRDQRQLPCDSEHRPQEPTCYQDDRHIDRERSNVRHVEYLQGRERDLKSKQRDADAHHLPCSKRNARLKQCRRRPDRGENETEDQAPDDGRPGQKRHPGRGAGDKRAEGDTRKTPPKPVRFDDPSRLVQHYPTPRDVREVVFAILTRDKQVISKTEIRRTPAISCYLCDHSERRAPR